MLVGPVFYSLLIKEGGYVGKWLLTWWEREERTWHSWWPRRPAWGQPLCAPGSRNHTCPMAGSGQTLRHCNQSTIQSSVPPTSASTPLLPSPSPTTPIPETPTPSTPAPSPFPDSVESPHPSWTLRRSPCPLTKLRNSWNPESWREKELPGSENWSEVSRLLSERQAREDEGEGRRPSDQEEGKRGGWAWFQRAHNGCRSQLWPLHPPLISHVFLKLPHTN